MAKILPSVTALIFGLVGSPLITALLFGFITKIILLYLDEEV